MSAIVTPIVTDITGLRTRARTAHQQGQLGEAQHAYTAWLAEAPDDPEALHGMAICAVAEGRSLDAVALFQKARELAPENPSVRRNLGVAYWTLNRRQEALESLDLANTMEPNNPHTNFNLAVALMGLGENDRARACYEKTLELTPMHALAHSNLIFMLDLAADDDRAEEERNKFEERHGPPARALWKPHTNTKDLRRRLRVGYVSGDFQFHSASFAFRPVLLHHDREKFEVFCYSATTNPDATTEWYRDEFRWRTLNHIQPAQFAEGIRRDGIDILVDLSGHSKDNQLLAFALKPAPIQVSAWGHALGTGLKAMDYLFSDPIVCPPVRRLRFAERVADLPSVVCFEPQHPAPDIPPLPDRPPTFGAYQRLEKVSATTLEMWTAVLRAVKGSRLILKCPDFDDPHHVARTTAKFVAGGVDASRLEFRGKTVHYEHLRQMTDCDVMLDTFPHGGGMSAIESLWMGIPIITRQGQSVQSRLASSFLTLLDVDGTVATGLDGYVALAKTMVGARHHLSVLRASLRERLLKSVLCDHKTYALAVESYYREFWEKWCAA